MCLDPYRSVAVWFARKAVVLLSKYLRLFALCFFARFSVRRMRERIEDSGSLGVAMREDSTLGIVDALLKKKAATPDQIINALCSQKVGRFRLGMCVLELRMQRV